MGRQNFSNIHSRTQERGEDVKNSLDPHVAARAGNILYIYTLCEQHHAAHLHADALRSLAMMCVCMHYLQEACAHSKG